MKPFIHLTETPHQQIWEGIIGRCVHGTNATVAVVELAPGSLVDLHHHSNEQIGLVLRGTMDFTVGSERRVLGPGDAYVIPSDRPHRAVAGPEGAVVVDVFAPVRAEWRQLPQVPSAKPSWP